MPSIQVIDASSMNKTTKKNYYLRKYRMLRWEKTCNDMHIKIEIDGRNLRIVRYNANVHDIRFKTESTTFLVPFGVFTIVYDNEVKAYP